MVEKDLRESAEKENQKLKVKKYMIMRPTLMSNDELLLPNGKMYNLSLIQIGKQEIQVFVQADLQSKFLGKHANETAGAS